MILNHVPGRTSDEKQYHEEHCSTAGGKNVLTGLIVGIAWINIVQSISAVSLFEIYCPFFFRAENQREN